MSMHAKVAQAGRPEKEPPVELEQPLACRTSSAYCFLAMPFAAIYIVIQPARQTVYRDALGMSVATQAMIVSIAKSLDFLLGFLVGKASDGLKTRWGRRNSTVKVPSWQRPSSPPAPLRSHLAALGGSALPGRGRPTGRPATASGARASRLRCRRFHGR